MLYRATGQTDDMVYAFAATSADQSIPSAVRVFFFFRRASLGYFIPPPPRLQLIALFGTKWFPMEFTETNYSVRVMRRSRLDHTAGIFPGLRTHLKCNFLPSKRVCFRRTAPGKVRRVNANTIGVTSRTRNHVGFDMSISRKASGADKSKRMLFLCGETSITRKKNHQTNRTFRVMNNMCNVYRVLYTNGFSVR